MRHYVAGFLFSPDQKDVALIRKERPAWQKGLYNGIGGKWEEGENGLQAMRREFREETGVDVSKWTPFCSIVKLDVTKCEPWTVHFYKSFEKVATLQSPTDEKVRWWQTCVVTSELNRGFFVPNLCWLIPMALEDLTAEVEQHNWPHEV